MGGGYYSPPPDNLCVDQLMVYDFHCPFPDVIHPLFPLHLILCFELFGDALLLGHLFRQQEHLLRCLFVDVSQIGGVQACRWSVAPCTRLYAPV